MKVVINKCFGGFGVSKAVYEELGIRWDGRSYITNEDLGISSDNVHTYRADPRLIEAIEKIGLTESSMWCSQLEIIDVVDIANSYDICWSIFEYDGLEEVYSI